MNVSSEGLLSCNTSAVLQLQTVSVVKGIWIPPRKPLVENKDYTQDEYVAQVSSRSFS